MTPSGQHLRSEKANIDHISMGRNAIMSPRIEWSSALQITTHQGRSRGVTDGHDGEQRTTPTMCVPGRPVIAVAALLGCVRCRPTCDGYAPRRTVRLIRSSTAIIPFRVHLVLQLIRRWLVYGEIGYFNTIAQARFGCARERLGLDQLWKRRRRRFVHSVRPLRPRSEQGARTRGVTSRMRAIP